MCEHKDLYLREGRMCKYKVQMLRVKKCISEKRLQVVNLFCEINKLKFEIVHVQDCVVVSNVFN